MKTKIVILIALIGFLEAYPIQADTVWIGGHHDILETDVYGEIYMYNEATATMIGGEVYKLETYDVTAFDMLGGEMELLYVHDDTTINIYGGTVGGLGATENAFVDLYAYDVIHHPTDGHFDRGWIEGKYLLNDSSFTFDLDDLGTYSHINVVPEPATLFLLVLGTLISRKYLHKTDNFDIIEFVLTTHQTSKGD